MKKTYFCRHSISRIIQHTPILKYLLVVVLICSCSIVSKKKVTPPTLKKPILQKSIEGSGFDLLCRGQEYYRSVMYGDFEKQYAFMSSSYRSEVSLKTFKKKFGQAIPPSLTKSKKKKKVVHISGAKTTVPSSEEKKPVSSFPLLKSPMFNPAFNPAMRKTGKTSLSKPSFTSNKLLYSFSKIKFLKNNKKAILYFSYIYFMRISLPFAPPVIIHEKKDLDIWIKEDGKWYRHYGKIQRAHISGSSNTKFSVVREESSRGTVIPIQKIINFKLREIAKGNTENNNVKYAIKKLAYIAPFHTYNWTKKKTPDLVETVLSAMSELLDDLQYSLKKAPTAKDVLKKIAGIQKLMDRTDDALKIYLRSEKNSPHDLETLMNLSDLFFKKKNPSKSLEYLEKYLDLNHRIKRSHSKPMIQTWIENTTVSPEQISEVFSKIEWTRVEESMLGLIRKEQWKSAANFIKKLYAFKGFSGNILNNVKKTKEKKKGIFKVSDFVPPPFRKSLDSISNYDISKILASQGYKVYLTQSLIGKTGISTPVDIRIRSAGYFLLNNRRIYGRYDNIIIGRKDVSPHRMGYNVVVINEKDGHIIERKNFNTCQYKKEVERMAEFIGGLKNGRIVAIASREGTVPKAWHKIAEEALYTIGCDESLLRKGNWAHAIIGVKGARRGQALEVLTPYPASAGIYKKNTPFTIQTLMKDNTNIEQIKRNSVFLSGAQPDDSLFLVFP